MMCDANYIFPVQPIMYPDESLLGFLKRLGEAMQVPSLGGILGLVGLPADPRPLATSGNLSALAQALRTSQARLDETRHLEADGKCHFSGWDTPRHFIRTDWARICPDCIAETPYHRSLWNLSFVNICVRHGTYLVSRCHKCHHPINWRHSGLLACHRCRASYLAAPRVSADPAIVSAMSRVLFHYEICKEEQADAPLVLWGTAFAEGVEFLMLLGRASALQNGLPAYEGKTVAWPNSDQILALGMAVADDWPFSLHGILDDLHARKGNVGGPKDMFGQFYKLASKQGEEPWRAALREALVDYLVRKPEIHVQPSNKLANEVLAGRGYVSGEVARQALEMTPHAFNRLKRLQIWMTVSRQSSRKADLYCLADVKKLKEKLDSALTLREVGKLIGLRIPAQLKKIGDSGFFGKAPADLQTDGRSELVRRSDVLQFMELVNCAADRNVDDCWVINWGTLRRKAAFVGVDLPDLLRVIKEKRLLPVRRGSRAGLLGLLFDRDAADAFLSSGEESVRGKKLLPQYSDALPTNSYRRDTCYKTC